MNINIIQAYLDSLPPKLLPIKQLFLYDYDLTQPPDAPEKTAFAVLADILGCSMWLYGRNISTIQELANADLAHELWHEVTSAKIEYRKNLAYLFNTNKFFKDAYFSWFQGQKTADDIDEQVLATIRTLLKLSIKEVD